MQNLSLFESNSQPFIASSSLSFNLSDQTNLNPITFLPSITKTKSYTPIAGCVLEHILTTTNLTNSEKLFYLTADSLSLINKNCGGNRSCALPSEDWADRLGCSRSLVFKMQQTLVKKGYFIINKDFDAIGRNKRNLITPTLPSSVFNHLNEKFPDRVMVEEDAPYDSLNECKRSYLDRTKLFIKLNYRLLIAITSNLQLNSQQKTIWLGFYIRYYKNYMLQAQDGSTSGKYTCNNDTSFSFFSSYQELADLYSCNIKHLSKSIKALEKLGFVKLEHLYIRKKDSHNSDNTDSCNGSYDTSNNHFIKLNQIQERQDQSLWKITLSLPKECILELEKVKNRSSFNANDTKMLATENNIDSILVHDYLILGGIKFNLTSEQTSSLKSGIIVSDDDDEGNNGAGISCDHTDTSCSPLPSSDNFSICDTYINSVIEELDSGRTLDKSKTSQCTSEYIDSSKTSSENLYSLEPFDNKEGRGDGIKCDPTFAKSTLLLNKDLLLKIKEFNSNLRAAPLVIFNDFLKKFKKDHSSSAGSIGKENNQKQKTTLEFNICSELIRNKLKELPKDKADKARKFAYSLVSKKLAIGYAAGLSKHELAKQLIHHAATWKPTKLGNISREKEIDTALSVAWKKIVGGTWQPPLEFAKAEILNYEYQHYRKKYQESGVLSREINSLEFEVNKLLGGWANLEAKIIEENKDLGNKENFSSSLLTTNLKPAQLANIESDNSMPIESNKLIMNDYCYSEDDYETELVNSYNVDLSHIADEQKYLKIQGSNTDLIEINTINHQQYFGKLKTLEVNDEGDLVMTMKPSNNSAFHSKITDFSSSSNLLVSSDQYLPCNKEDNREKPVLSHLLRMILESGIRR
jgi:hypothetical protein